MFLYHFPKRLSCKGTNRCRIHTSISATTSTICSTDGVGSDISKYGSICCVRSNSSSSSHNNDYNNNDKCNHNIKNTKHLTPAEAGRRAQQLLKQRSILLASPNNTTDNTIGLYENEVAALSSSTTSNKKKQQSMDTILSHSGFVPFDENDTDDDSPNVSPQQQRPKPWNAPIAPPIYLSTTYIRPVHGMYNTNHDAIYIREGNPTRVLLEQQMSILELLPSSNVTRTSSSFSNDTSNHSANQCYSFAMSSGMMAISTVIMAHPLPVHILLPIDLYHGVPSLLRNVFVPFATSTTTTTTTANQAQPQPKQMISYERVDMRYHTSSSVNGNTEKEISSTKTKTLREALQSIPDETSVIVWIETPSNPLCHMIDIGATCSIVRSIRNNSNNKSSITSIVVDSTLAPPNITQPLLIQPPTTISDTTSDDTSNNHSVDTNNSIMLDGVDVAIHAATKYIGGHSDTMGGIITVSPYTKYGPKLCETIRNIQCYQGGIMSSIDSYMMIRGLRTLHVRVERQCNTALEIANYLHEHYVANQNEINNSYIKRIYYPGIKPSKSSKNYKLELQQYTIAQKQMNNGLFGSILSIEFYTEQQAMAFIGGLQIILRATSFGGTETLIEHRASIKPIGQQTSPDGLVRLSVGLESINDLITDIESGLKIMKHVCS